MAEINLFLDSSALIAGIINAKGAVRALLLLAEVGQIAVTISYLVAALQIINAGMGEGLLVALQSPQPPSTESILTTLLNEITAVPHNFILVLDDYHVIDSIPIDQAITFLLEHLPPRMHLVFASREDPHLPLARLRARAN